MKILIIQEKGRHEKNWMFRESLNIQRSLNKLGYESTVWGLNYDTYKTSFEEMEKTINEYTEISKFEESVVTTFGDMIKTRLKNFEEQLSKFITVE